MKKYNVVYADCPWEYRNKKTGGSMVSGSQAKYKTMTLQEICAFPIHNIIQKNCVLGLWATVPMLKEAMVVMDAWGFKYKTKITWRKIMCLGMGFWYRGQIEDLLIGIKGKVPAFRLQESNFIQTKALRHSQKPEEMREKFQRGTDKIGFIDRVELFARNETIGWDVYGDECHNSIKI